MKTRSFAAALLFLAAVGFSPIAEAQTAPNSDDLSCFRPGQKVHDLRSDGAKETAGNIRERNVLCCGVGPVAQFYGSLALGSAAIYWHCRGSNHKERYSASRHHRYGQRWIYVGLWCRGGYAGIWRRSNRDRLCPGWPAARVRRLCEDCRSRRQDGRTLCFEYRQNRGP